MVRMFSRAGALLDIALLSTFALFVGVLVNKPALSPVAYFALLFALMIAANAISIKREARIERQLDELELASVSFGSRWAVSAIGIAAMLFLFVTPLQDAVVAWFQQVESNVGARGGRAMSAPATVFLLGMVVAMAIYLTAKSTLAAIWTWTKR